jgi:hypothetical protein
MKLRKRRLVVGKHRTWEILPRYGTGPDDRWTVIGNPIPSQNNPCASTEDGQFPDLAAARWALDECERLDDGSHDQDDLRAEMEQDNEGRD